MSTVEPEAADGPELAAENALGVLDGRELATARRRLLTDPGFAREVEGWEARLAALTEAVAPVPPPEALWERVVGQLDKAATAGGGGGEVVVLQRRVALWRTAAATASALAACLALALAWPHAPSASVLTARLSASGKGAAVFVALYDPARRAIVLTPASVDAKAGRSPELWLIPSGGKPVAIGVADFASSVKLVPIAGEAGLGAGVLAVSLEPQGGSPTGQPTGPVIATGQLSRL